MLQQLTGVSGHRPATKVPFLDLRTHHRDLKTEILEKWGEVLDTASFIAGPQVQEFENAFAAYCGVKHAIAVANGTDALTLALSALGVGHGDEVITAANSFIATAEAIVHAGATPVFVDVDPRTYNIDIRQIESNITARTKALIPVHLFGQPADMDPILRVAGKYNLPVIEDSAQAHGARYKGRRAGSMGDVGCFSFYPGKNLGACGDAGAVVTNDAHLAMQLKKLRDHGGIKKYQHDRIGYNSRMDTLQAAVLLAKLNDLDARNEMRRAHAETYNQLLSRIPGIVTPVVIDHVESVYHLYVIQLQKGSQNGLQQYLLESGVQTGIHYPTPIHKTTAFSCCGHLHLPIAEGIAERMLSLPMYPELERSQIEYVAENISIYMSQIN